MGSGGEHWCQSVPHYRKSLVLRAGEFIWVDLFLSPYPNTMYYPLHMSPAAFFHPFFLPHPLSTPRCHVFCVMKTFKGSTSTKDQGLLVRSKGMRD